MARPRSAVFAGDGESRRPGIHLEGVTGRRRRRHLHETVLRHALRHAAIWQGGLHRARQPHTLRHSFATDPLEDDHDIRTLQKPLEHCDTSTP